MHVGKIAAMAAMLGIFSLCGGCATVVRGSGEPVTFDSEPPGAEMRSVIDSPCGGPCPPPDHGLGDKQQYVEDGVRTEPVPGPACVTPCTLQVDRNKELIVTFTKPGYHAQTVKLSTKVSGGGAAGVAGNVILGGAIGLGVDAVSGAGLDHYPNPLKVTLVPMAAAEPASRRPKR